MATHTHAHTHTNANLFNIPKFIKFLDKYLYVGVICSAHETGTYVPAVLDVQKDRPKWVGIFTHLYLLTLPALTRSIVQ